MSEEGATFAEIAASAMIELLGEGALIFEGDDLLCVGVRGRAADWIHQPAEALIGQPRAQILARVRTADEASGARMIAMGVLGAEETRQETITIDADPSRVVRWTSGPIKVFDHAVGRVDVLSDRTEEHRLSAAIAEAEARILATTLTDEVTGLSNRRHFEGELDREHRRSQRAWAPYAIVRIDVDGMAKINADLGRPQGDALLRKIGEALRVARREYDVVARWEEDELCALLPGLDQPSVKGVLERSLEAMREAAREVVGREVTFSVGVALWIPPSVEVASDIVARAGMALEAAKVMGPGSVEIDATLVEWKDA